MEPHLSLFTIPREILFSIFKRLDRPSKLSLSLTSPQMLHLFATYYDLDRYRSAPLFIRKISLPETVSWQDPKAQGAIIRYIAMPGGDDIDDPPVDEAEGTEGDAQNFEDENYERMKPYEETLAGIEDAVVEGIIEEWLRRRCGVESEVVLCGECYRFMRLQQVDGRENLWAKKMLERPIWFRHCGPCDDAYGIPRDARIT